MNFKEMRKAIETLLECDLHQVGGLVCLDDPL